jgi:hypothetical protein
MKSFEDLFAEYLSGPEMLDAARKSGIAAILFFPAVPATFSIATRWPSTGPCRPCRWP